MKTSIYISSLEKLIADVWIASPSAAAIMLEFMHNRMIPIDNLWIEREYDRRIAERADSGAKGRSLL